MCNIDPQSTDIVLPITTSMNKSGSSEYDKFKMLTHNYLSPIASVQVFEPFPFDLAFAMTIHKAQGRTIPLVIVDLTQHPLRVAQHVYSSVFVALSRVETSENLRLLEPVGATRRPRHLLYEWLQHLEPDENIKPFLRGFSTENGNWSTAHAIGPSPHSSN